MWCLKRFKKFRQRSEQPAPLGIPAYIPAGPLGLGATLDPDVPLEDVNNGEGPQTTLPDGRGEDPRFPVLGASTWIPERENSTKAPRECGREPGVPPDTTSEQLGQNFPRLHPGPESPPATVPKYIFDSDRFGEVSQHGARFMTSWAPEKTRRDEAEHTPDDDQVGEDAQHTVRSTSAPPVKIAVMGATGSGKTTFINLASGSNLRVGTGSESFTAEVQVADEFTIDGRVVTLIDTPGFDDTSKSDTDILQMIAAFLAITYERGTTLAGVIYVHHISDNRFGGISGRNSRMFRQLCGEFTLGLESVVIVTNMWEGGSRDVDEAREKELSTGLFKTALDEGARIVRHDGTAQSAFDIVRRIVMNHREYSLFTELSQNVRTSSEQEGGWQGDALYGCLVKIRDIHQLGSFHTDLDFLMVLSKAMEEGKPFRVRKAAYDVVDVARDGWLKSAEFRQALKDLDFPRRLHHVVLETGRSDHQRSFLTMMEILSEDRYWHPYLRESMDLWLPFRYEEPGQVLRIFARVGELLLPEHGNSNLAKLVEDEWARVPGRPVNHLTADRLEPLAEVTVRLKGLLFTESERREVLAVVEAVVPLLERLESGEGGPGEDTRDVVDALLGVLRVPV